MPIDQSKKVAKQEAIQALWNKAVQKFIPKNGNKVLSDNNYSDEDKAKLAAIEAGANAYELPIASADDLGGIRLGAGLAIDSRGVVNTVANNNINVGWANITNTPTTVAGYGLTDAATKSEVAAVEAKITGVYKYAGSVAEFSDLANIENVANGTVYNVEADGQNYAWNEEAQEWDSLGAIIDLSGYLTEDDISPLTAFDIDMITGSASTATALSSLIAESNEVELSNDVTIPTSLFADHDVTINLNGNKLTSNADGYAIVANGAKVIITGNGELASNTRLAQAQNGGEIVIENGTFNSGDVAFSALGEGSKVTMNGGDLTAFDGGIGAFDGGEIEMNSGTITGIDNFALFTNGTAGRGGNTITMNGGKLVGNIRSDGYEAVGIYIANNDTFVMNDGEIIANNGCGILMRAGDVTINGGTITATGEAGTTGWVGDNKTKMSKSAVIYHESANYPGKAGMSLYIGGGTFNGVDHALEILSNEATPNVTVAGGTFNPAYPEA